MNKIIENLTEVWFWKNEAIVYLSILTNWKSFISDILKDTKLKRSSIINYVENLLHRWILSKVVVWKRLAYIAEKPDTVLEDFNLRKKKFEKSLPELNNLFLNNSQKAKVRYFEWKKWLNKIYLEIVSQFKPIYSFISLEEIISAMWIENLNNMRDIRVKNWTKIKDLIEDTKFSREFMKTRKIALWNSNKFLPKTFPVTIDLLIWWDNVAMISFEKQMWVIIENKEIADFHRNLHKHFWMFL